MEFKKGQAMNTYNRGDAASADFDKTTLTADGTFYDLDLSGIIPAGTKFVQLQVKIMGIAAGKDVRFREKGHTGLPVTVNMITPAIGIQAFARFWIGVDNARKIQYYSIAHVWSQFDVTVVAWKK